jgi:hypothetical protein
VNILCHLSGMVANPLKIPGDKDGIRAERDLPMVNRHQS